MSYIPMTTKILQMLRPCRVLLDGTMVLRADTSIDCLSADYRLYVDLAWFLLAAFCFGLPLIFFCLLRFNSDGLFDEYGPKDDRGRPCVPTEAINSRIGFLYTEFEAGYW